MEIEEIKKQIKELRIEEERLKKFCMLKSAENFKNMADDLEKLLKEKEQEK